MIIIGIDPGYAIVGVGVIEYKGNKFRPIEYNAITTHSSICYRLLKEGKSTLHVCNQHLFKEKQIFLQCKPHS